MSPAQDPLVLLTAESTKFHIGADECGLGALAGPAIVCAVISEDRVSACRDSKKYSGKDAAHKIKKMERDIDNSTYLRHHIIQVPPDRLVRVGYSESLGRAYRASISALRHRVSASPEVSPATIDGDHTFNVPFSAAYPRADSISPLVSLASCIGKAHQIEVMLKIAERFPGYGFEAHCGYGTDEHLEAIRRYGLIVGVHRIPIIIKMALMQGTKLTYHKDRL